MMLPLRTKATHTSTDDMGTVDIVVMYKGKARPAGVLWLLPVRGGLKYDMLVS